MVIFILAVFGLIAGSFINALVWRVKQQTKKGGADKKLSVLNGRSMCPDCRHELAVKDLIPVFSWLVLRGRCRYCKKPISIQYPLVELITALVFMASYLWWPADLSASGQVILLITWLISSDGLIALAVYDLRWMILPNKILYPTFFIAATGQAIYLIGYAPNKLNYLISWLAAVIAASGIFWLIFYASKGKWIGYGDVRLGLITGTILAKPSLALLMIFVGSLLGSLVALPLIAFGKKGLSAKIAYGPFLIAATFFCLFFGQNFIDWYKNLLSL